MSVEASYLLGAVAMGLGATLVMDPRNLFPKRAFGIPSLNYCLLGRWLLHMPGGTLRHAALLYGIGTVVCPFVIMQPSLGFGIAASKTPKPTQARLKSLATYTVYGVGLYVCVLGVSYLVPTNA